MFDFILLGAEKQSATSFALSYPDKKFLFLSDQKVVDGWDLPNVTIKHSTANGLEATCANYSGTYISLSTKSTSKSIAPGFISEKQSCFDKLNHVYKAFPDISLVLTKNFSEIPSKTFLVKGDFWHKPDAQQTVKAGNDEVPKDVYGCGYFYQELVDVEEKYISTGRAEQGNLHLGLFKLHRESIAREEYVLAAETISDEQLLSLTKSILNYLKHEGFFTLTWICSKGRLFLTSIRPEPKALILTLKKAGIDLVDLKPGIEEIANAGFKMIGGINYSSYQPLFN